MLAVVVEVGVVEAVMGEDEEAGEVVVGVAAVAVVVAGVSVLQRYFINISMITIHSAVENLDEVYGQKNFSFFTPIFASFCLQRFYAYTPR